MLPAAILAGGLGTRMHDITHDEVPKCLIPIDGQPFLLLLLDWLWMNDLRQIVICAGHLAEQVEAVVSSFHRRDLQITIHSDGEQPIGTAAALRNTMSILGDAFFVIYGDCYPIVNFEYLERLFLESHKPAMMTLYKAAHGNITYEDETFIRYNKYRPTPEMHYTDYGVSIVTASVLQRSQRNDLAHVYADLGSNIVGRDIFHQAYEIGSPDGLERTKQYLGVYRNVSQ